MRGKLQTLSGVIIVLMVLLGVANIAIVTSVIHSMQSILDDNQISYNMQQAVSEEVYAFKTLIYNENAENTEAYEKAEAYMLECLDALPLDYQKIGEKRYELTWTIKNSYTQYHIQQEKVRNMDGTEASYVDELYKLYRMQDYLLQYCGDLSAQVLEESNTEYVVRSRTILRVPYILIVIMLLILGLTLFAQNSMMEMELLLHNQALEKAELEKKFAFAQFQALKNKLDPHFLFNTLNIISRMAKLEGASTSEQMMLAMSNLLRYNLRTTASVVPINEELKAVEDYLYIQKMRFGNRLNYEIHCEAAADRKVPVYLLQPLVENAVIHGISGEEKGGTIYISVVPKEEKLHIVVKDTGCGMSRERVEEVRASMHQKKLSKGIGLENLERRIGGLFYNSSVSIDSVEGQGTEVVVEFGAQREEG